MKILARYTVVEHEDGTTHVYDEWGEYAPTPILDAITRYFNKKDGVT